MGRLDTLVLRSCWDYHRRASEFMAWLNAVERAGVRLWNPSRLYATGDRTSLADVIATTGWTDAIVGPAISASATDTWRTGGEWSVMIIDGAFSHGVIKRPKAGGFRVQAELGGSAAPAQPPSAVVTAALHIASLVPEPCLFLRIDGVETDAGFTLMEVEALEPLLFLAFAPSALEAMARALARAGGPATRP